jgi:hypothetical protein
MYLYGTGKQILPDLVSIQPDSPNAYKWQKALWGVNPYLDPLKKRVESFAGAAASN